MKKLTTLGFILSMLFAEAKAQSESLYRNYINKEDFFINVSYLRTYKDVIQESLYRSNGLEIGAGYYFFDKVGLKTSFSIINFNKIGQEINKNVTNEVSIYDRKSLMSLNNQLRYHFYDKTHCGTMFVQTGYKFGKFEEGKKTIKSWEIASFGVSTPLFRKYLPNLSWEGTIGINKSNLQDKAYYPWQLGLNYFFGKSGSN